MKLTEMLFIERGKSNIDEVKFGILSTVFGVGIIESYSLRIGSSFLTYAMFGSRQKGIS